MEGQLNTIPNNLPNESASVPAMRVVSRIEELYSPEYFGGLSQLAAAAFRSRLFGELTPDQLFIILMTGREMGLPPTVALRNIGSFKGKTVISSQLQMAKVKEAGYEVKILENTNERATVSVGRKGEDPYSKTFTMADATQAGLLNRNELYKTNPSTMLLNRAIGLACRYGAPEVLNGLHNESELIEIDEFTDRTPPVVKTIIDGWSIEEQESFEVLKDRAYKAYKDGGLEGEKLSKTHSGFSERWSARKHEKAGVVLADMEAKVVEIEVAVVKSLKAKADAAAKQDVDPAA